MVRAVKGCRHPQRWAEKEEKGVPGGGRSLVGHHCANILAVSPKQPRPPSESQAGSLKGHQIRVSECSLACKVWGALDSDGGGASAPLKSCEETGLPLPQPGLLFQDTPHLTSQRSRTPDSFRRELEQGAASLPGTEGSKSTPQGHSLAEVPRGMGGISISWGTYAKCTFPSTVAMMPNTENIPRTNEWHA